MSKINIPDPQHLEMNALDEAFYSWLWNNSQLPQDEIEWIAEEYGKIDDNALVYTSEDMYDDYDPMTGEYGASCMLAMENNMQERIEAKRRFIERINEDE